MIADWMESWTRLMAFDEAVERIVGVTFRGCPTGKWKIE
jgi:hypothetical protein